jgi:hypothetical protein
MLNPNAIPLLSKDVVTRSDSNGMLLFQVRTDEMHFISEAAYSVLNYCNGSQTISEIKAVIEPFLPSSNSSQIDRFFESLVERNVIELID